MSSPFVSVAVEGRMFDKEKNKIEPQGPSTTLSTQYYFDTTKVIETII